MKQVKPASTATPLLPRRSWLGELWATLSGPRLRPVRVLAVTGLVVFAVFRACLLLASTKLLGGVSSADIGKCFLVGLWYDAMPIGYVVLPMLVALLLAPAAVLTRAWFRNTIAVYASSVTVVLLGVEIAGAAFYLAFGTKLNWLAVEHLGHFVEPAEYIWTQYPVWLLVLGSGLACFVLVMAYTVLLWRQRYTRAPMWARLVCLVLLGALAVLGCRGSFRRPLQYGPSYFCDNKALAQLTLNNIFTLTHALRAMANDNLEEDEFYPFPDLDRAEQVTVELLTQEADRPTGSARNPLWRLTNTSKPRKGQNVVLILMEGMTGAPVGALGHSPSHTPRFDQLCREGLFFERMYAVGNRTSRAVVGSLCGHPDLGGLSVMKRLRSQGNFLSLPAVFKERGYRTLFMYGGDPNFDNMKKFFQADGIETYVSEDDMMGPPELKDSWGYHDEVIFQKAHETFLSLGTQPFFAVILTVSNHKPYEVPPGRVELLQPINKLNMRINGYRYADWALGDFFRRAAEAEYFRNTIFVLVADHAQVCDQRQLCDVVSFRVPCLFYAPGIIQPRRVGVIGSQADIPPTLLAMLGGRYEHGFMGRNLLEVEPGDGFALVHDDDRLALIRGDHALVLPSGSQPMLFQVDTSKMERVPDEKADPKLIQQLQLQMLSYYGMARHLYLTCSYQDPAKAPPVYKRR